MPIIDSRDENLNTSKDVKRHHDKVKDAIKKNLPEILSEEEIITRDNKGRKIRIPVKSIDIPDLRHGKRNKDGEGDGQGEAGMGQGPGKKGDVMGKRKVAGQGDGGKPSKPGEEAGEDMIESEFTVEEIIEMMLEDIGLPNLLKKDLSTIEVSLGYKISGSEKVGPMVLLQRRPTTKNAMKTFWAWMSILQEKFPNKSELDCFAALKLADGVACDAEKFLSDDGFEHSFIDVEPFPIIGNEDLRFFQVEEKKTSETNAVVFALLDVSGSMSDMKKYIARAILFWMVSVLRKQYTNIEIRFIVHHTEARLVEEKDFFRTKESGGTKGSSAFALVNELIRDKYPTGLWNVYTFYFSDGDDFEPIGAAAEMKKMIDSGINMFGFANIKEEYEDLDKDSSWGLDLIKHIKETWPVSSERLLVDSNDRSFMSESIEIISGDNGFPFLAATINNKKHIFPVLKEFLKKKRG